MTSILAASAAFIVAVAVTPLFASWARRLDLVARGRSDRWGVPRPTPLLGGAAIVIAACGTMAAFAPDARMLVVLVAGLAAFGLGLLDDMRHLAASTKLVGQVLVASVLVVGGIRVEIIEFAPVAYLLTLLWVVGIMNAVNLMDNMDGLAAGIAVIAGGALALTALPENPAAAIVGASTAGAALGFLLHNFSPARVFMGDAGSQVLGVLLAAAALMHTASAASNVVLALLAPLAVLALPIFDTILVTVSRGLAGISVSKGGRDHSSHRLAALGLSDRDAVVLLYLVAAIFAALGVFIETALSSVVLPLVAIAAIGLLLFGVFLHEVEVYGWRSDSTRQEESQPRHRAVSRALLVYGRFGVEIMLDVTLLTIAYFSSYLIRYELAPESSWLHLFIESVPVVVAAQLGALVLLRVYRTLWKYMSVADALVIVRAVAIGTAIGALTVAFLFRFDGYPRSVLLIDVLLAAGLLVGARSFFLWLRHWFAFRPRPGAASVLIVGASDRGALALRLLTASSESSWRVVGYLDDDPGKRHRHISGVPVIGTIDELEARLARSEIGLVVLALPERESEKAEDVRRVCGLAGVPCRDLRVSV